MQQEENRLLYDDDNTMQYGSFAEGHGGDDSIEAQRENEALQQVVAKTSRLVGLMLSIKLLKLPKLQLDKSQPLQSNY